MAGLRRESLETLLRIRKRQEDLRAQALADTRRSVRESVAQRDELLDEKRRILDRAGEMALLNPDAADLRRYHHYERHLARMADSKDADIRALTFVAEERRAALEDATKRKRIVEKLRERRMLARMRKFRRDEQRAADEVANNYAAFRGNDAAK